MGYSICYAWDNSYDDELGVYVYDDAQEVYAYDDVDYGELVLLKNLH